MKKNPRYLLIGSGRLARHLLHYFKLLSIPIMTWSRAEDPQADELAARVAACDFVLLLISDNAIEDFIATHVCLQQKTLIHCSGSLVTDLAYSAHPLMTFARELYSLETYASIPFILQQAGPLFSDIFPRLSNPRAYIKAEDKPLYHSLCVLAGNFSCLLWQKMFTDFEQRLGLPKALVFPYLQQVFTNLMQDSEQALTGPLARGDQTIIQANLVALDQDSFQQVYQAFVATFQEKDNLIKES